MKFKLPSWKQVGVGAGALVLLAVVGYFGANYYLKQKYDLNPQQYYVLKQGGTELPYTSPLLKENRAGTYVTVDCGVPVYRSEQKYESGTGWPSFTAPIRDALILKPDDSLGLNRTETVDSKCQSHLGHVFTDGPEPTGLRYCMNGLALRFIPDGASGSYSKDDFEIDMRTAEQLSLK